MTLNGFVDIKELTTDEIVEVNGENSEKLSIYLLIITNRHKNKTVV